MSLASRKLIQATAGATTVDTGDDDFANVVLLLDGDGTSGDANNTFTDSSTNGFTITENGSVVQGSFSPYGDNWSVFFDGSGDYLDYGSDAGFQFGSGDFTIEAWFYATEANASTDYHIISYATNSTNFWAIRIRNAVDRGLEFRWFEGSEQVAIYQGSDFTDVNSWHHVAVTRSGNSWRMFLDGTQVGSTVTNSGSITGFTNLQIADLDGLGFEFKGYISNARLVKGTAVYTSNFTPSTSPLTAITNTSFLGCQSNRFKDSSTTDASATVSGTPKVSPFSPFKNDDARDITTDGGSAYVANANYLDVGSTSDFTFGTGDFTVEAWIYITDGSQSFGIFNVGGASTGAFALYWNRTTHPTHPKRFELQRYGDPAGSGRTTNQYDINQWLHVRAIRSSGTSKLFINGVEDVGASYSMGNCSQTNIAEVGRILEGAATSTTAYIADLRVEVGTATSTSNFTPPTSPVSTTANTDLLLNFQDAGIYDRSGINNLDTVGDARLGFAPIYGTGSLAFDGTGDYLELPSNEDLALGTGDFTIETWVNISSFTSYGHFASTHVSGSPAAGSWFFRLNSNNQSWQWQNGSNGSATNFKQYNSSTNLTAGQWHHLAVVRENGVTTLYQDGVDVGGGVDVENLIAPVFTIGAATNGYPLNGYLDDFRITKGVARYTSSFTPPDEIDLSTDTHREYVTLFLDGDGTLNGQNNTFTDSSTNGFTVTKNGDVTQGVFSPYGDNWSNYFNDDGYLQVTKSTDLDLDTNNWTIECWLNLKSASAPEVVLNFGYETETTRGYIVYLNSSGALHFAYSTNGSNNTDTSMGSHGIVANEWTHLAVVRNGSTITGYINGSALGTTINIGSSDIYYPTSGNVRIGSDGTNALAGYISNIRLVNGTAVYTSNFTPSTSPLTAITNTKLLTCQSNRFQDNSTSSHAITVGAGTPEVTRFSPFESNKPYDITTDGGSGYFDGTGNYLTLSDDLSLRLGTGDFTIEFWINQYSKSSYQTPVAKGYVSSGDYAIQTGNGDGNMIFYASGTAVATESGSTVNVGEWYHIAVVRSGTAVTIYRNGTSVATGTSSANLNTTSSLFIGQGSTYAVNGYLSDVRIVKGTAVYTSAFTPPTAPLTAVTNTSALLNFQDSAIPDLSGLNNIDTVGNAKVGASDPTKYGSNAMQFDGTGDYLTTPSSEEFVFGTGDFTIEGWAYNAGDTHAGLFQISSTAGGLSTSLSNTLAVGMRKNSSVWQVYANGSATNATQTWSANTWYHFAMVRNSGVLKLYVDGTAVITIASDTTNYTCSNLVVGGYYSTSYLLNGYIDDFRITKGVARYTANFTPPTDALPKF